MIATGTGSILLASLDKLFDFCRAEVLRNLGEPPLRHSRNSRREVTVSLRVAEEKAEEGAQSRHRQLNDLGRTRASAALEESRDVTGSYLAKTQWGIAKAFNEEPLDEGPVSGDSCRRKPALFLEVALIALSQCCQRGSIRCGCW